jgi:hypothetical protein
VSLTHSISDATFIAAVKGIVAALVSLGFAAALGYEWPSFRVLAAAATLGLVGYGVSRTECLVLRTECFALAEGLARPYFVLLRSSSFFVPRAFR